MGGGASDDAGYRAVDGDRNRAVDGSYRLRFPIAPCTALLPASGMAQRGRSGLQAAMGGGASDDAGYRAVDGDRNRAVDGAPTGTPIGIAPWTALLPPHQLMVGLFFSASTFAIRRDITSRSSIPDRFCSEYRCR